MLKFLINKGEVELAITGEHADALLLIKHIELFPKMRAIVDLSNKNSTSRKVNVLQSLDILKPNSFFSFHLVYC